MNIGAHFEESVHTQDDLFTCDALLRKSVLICLGPGGIGKTTVSAALAVAGATKGLRVCVITIDPARRLADALGIGHIDNKPKTVNGPWSGKLDAVMLNAGATFDDLITKYAKDASQANEIQKNNLYINLTSRLSGTQEYMASEKLFELHDSGGYDLIVVDTPPSRHAIDFLDAPENLFSFLDNKIFRLITNHNRYVRAVSVATQLLLKTIAKVAGAEIVEDAISFFRAFDGMEEGFRERATGITHLFKSDQSAFVLITSPQKEIIQDTKFFSGALKSRSYEIDALVVNKLLPAFDEKYEEIISGNHTAFEIQDNPVSHITYPIASDTEHEYDRSNRQAGEDLTKPSNSHFLKSTTLSPMGFDENIKSIAWYNQVRNIKELAAVAGQQKRLVDELTTTLNVDYILRIPLLEEDVHDLKALEIIADKLLTEQLPLNHG